MNTILNWRFAFLLFSFSIIVYLPGLPGDFIYDDYFNFLQNSTIVKSGLNFSDAWSAALSGESGPLGRPIAMFSFYLNYQFSGLSPLCYKITNIAIHGLNTVLVFFIMCRLLNLFVIQGKQLISKSDTEIQAFWITLLWAIHPINLTAVLYIVQRMTSMSATFTLLGIYCYLDFREKINSDTKQILVKISFIIFLGISAALCKENGLLLFLFLFVIEYFLFKWHFDSLKEKWCVKLFYIFVLFIPICFASILLLNGELTANYSERNFDLLQRTLTEFRVLWFYILQVMIPQANLFGLHHDDFVVSKNLFDPYSTFFAIISFILIIALAVKLKKKFPWFLFGLIFFLSGHAMESTILPLNLVHEHRNYLPSLGLIIILMISLNLMTRRVSSINRNIVFIFISIIFSSITISRAYDWSDLILLSERLVQRHPNSVTSNYQVGYVYSKIYQQTNNNEYGKYAKKALKKAESISKVSMQPAIALVHVTSMLKEAEDVKLINKIADRFSYDKIKTGDVISLRQLVNCKIKKICHLNEETLRKLFDSLLENTGLNGRIRDDVIYIYSTYLSTLPESVERALLMMHGIADKNPSILEYQVKLVSMLLEAGKIKEANILMESLTEHFNIKWEVLKK